jgi:diacylglycerol kinase family enzyme
MHPEELATSISRLVERSPAFPGEALAVDLIANPRAGGFLRPAYSARHKAALAALEARAAALPRRGAPTSLRLHLTERSGHASEIARGIVADARSDGRGTRRLVMTAGGDGTSLEAATSLVELPEPERARFAILRLPMGTGNDGSDGRELEACLGRLLGPMAYEPRPALRVAPRAEGGARPLWSFNIASVGLDAFVCEMTNKLKAIFPGDFFKFWVDVSSIFYDRIWPPAPMTVTAFDAKGAEVDSFTEPCLLVAMGASGHRTYGSNTPILPDDDNLCSIRQMPLFKKLALKGRLTTGRHRGLDVVRLFSARRVRIDYGESILLQREGEVTRLEAADFPLEIQVTDPIYNVLVPA